MALWVVAQPVKITLSIQCAKIRDEEKHGTEIFHVIFKWK